MTHNWIKPAVSGIIQPPALLRYRDSTAMHLGEHLLTQPHLHFPLVFLQMTAGRCFRESQDTMRTNPVVLLPYQLTSREIYATLYLVVHGSLSKRHFLCTLIGQNSSPFNIILLPLGMDFRPSHGSEKVPA